MAQHRWDEGETLLGLIVSECKVCGGFRSRNRLVGADYLSGQGIHIDMVGSTRRGWCYGATPRSCPGRPVVAPLFPATPELVSALETVLEASEQFSGAGYDLFGLDEAQKLVGELLERMGGEAS